MGTGPERAAFDDVGPASMLTSPGTETRRSWFLSGGTKVFGAAPGRGPLTVTAICPTPFACLEKTIARPRFTGALRRHTETQTRSHSPCMRPPVRRCGRLEISA